MGGGNVAAVELFGKRGGLGGMNEAVRVSTEADDCVSLVAGELNFWTEEAASDGTGEFSTDAVERTTNFESVSVESDFGSTLYP
jgi:hypothetical protein